MTIVIGMIVVIVMIIVFVNDCYKLMKRLVNLDVDVRRVIVVVI